MNKTRIGLASLLTLLPVCFGLPASLASSPSAASPASVAKPPSSGAAHPDQSSVAAKVALKVVPAAGPQVKSALSAGDVKRALGLVGKPAALQGTVTKVYSPGDHDIVILDFSEDYRNTITAVARPESYKKLPDLKMLAGKHILVTGPVTTYRGKPEFELESAAQLSVIK